MKKVTVLSSAGIASLILSVAAGGGGAFSLLAGCSGGGGKGGGTTSTASSTTSTGQGGGDTGISTAQRTAAATTAATTSPWCTGLPTAFYWEIGDATGKLASGDGGAGAGAVDPSVSMPIDSASKWLFGAYALEKASPGAIADAGNVPYLNFTSGYDALVDDRCLLSQTVEECFAASDSTGSNDTQNAGDEGKFFYNGGHLQAYAVNVAGLGGDYDSHSTKTPQLADDIEAAIGDIGLTYNIPLLAGGGAIAPNGYAMFLRRILEKQLVIGSHLGEDAVCAWTHHSDCNALYSPVNETLSTSLTNNVSDEQWHYSLAHWVEQDGTFSSPGKAGFYPWIDATETYYGILARYDTKTLENVNGQDQPPYFTSVECGTAIRDAWIAGHS